MTRIVVVSDTHGAFDVLLDLIKRYQKEAACFIHCGDGAEELEELHRLMPNVPVYAVRGNCDDAAALPASRIVEAGGHRIFVTHGHLFGVGASEEPIQRAAREAGADIVLYGHLHRGTTHYDDGLYVMNPGSPVRPRDSKASFGLLDLSDAGVVCHLVPYERKYR